MRIDCHSHVGFRDGRLNRAHLDVLIDSCDRLGIDISWVSSPVSRGMGDMDEVRARNNAVLDAVKVYPTRLQGYCFVMPGFYRKALDEIDRCLDAGMIGIKLYQQYFIDDPAVYPVIEKAVDEGIIVLTHAGHVQNAADRAAQPKISDGVHCANIARRYPELNLIMGHIGGGGDYEWSLQAIVDTPNVYADTSGSVIDEGIVDYAVQLLGVDRVMFGCDWSQEAGVGKVLAADLTDAEREKVFAGNAQRLLQRRR